MKIVEKEQNEIYIFKLNGRLDYNASPELEEKILKAIENGSTNMVVDCEDLDYISTAGLRVILKAAKALKRSEGTMILCAMQDYVKRVFEITGFDCILPVVAGMDDALKPNTCCLIRPQTEVPRKSMRLCYNSS